jgi:glutamate-5-semialdehyde dehydrogenase
MDIQTTAKNAKQSSIQLAGISGEMKNRALTAIARFLDENRTGIIAANKADLERAQKEKLAAPLLKRLKFDDAKIDEAISGLKSLIALPDPVGVTQSAMELDEGLELFKVACPIGVIGIVFESRPDALVQISCLCLKSGNAVLMKGGSEASQTNRMLADLIHKATVSTGIPDGWLTLLEARSDVTAMLSLDDHIDLIVPRGSNEFVKYIMDNTNIPVLGHADGICHVYVDSPSDMDMAVKIIVDSKTQYVAVCNAAETVLVHKYAAADLLPRLKAALDEKGVEIRGCEATRKIIEAKPAIEDDWRTEYLDLIISIKIVDSIDAAIGHINRYGSGHTDVIVTSDKTNGVKFMDYVDSACVFLNASSRFSDGFRFGLGAEVGISTSKIHARGPVGLEGLLIYKWRLVGNGHIVADYSGKTARQFTHRLLKKNFNS